MNRRAPIIGCREADAAQIHIIRLKFGLPINSYKNGFSFGIDFINFLIGIYAKNYRNMIGLSGEENTSFYSSETTL